MLGDGGVTGMYTGCSPLSVKYPPPSELLWLPHASGSQEELSVCTASKRRSLHGPLSWTPVGRHSCIPRQCPVNFRDEWLGSPLPLFLGMCVPGDRRTEAGRTGEIRSRQSPEFAAPEAHLHCAGAAH